LILQEFSFERDIVESARYSLKKLGCGFFTARAESFAAVETRSCRRQASLAPASPAPSIAKADKSVIA